VCPTRIQCLNESKYVFGSVDGYSRYTWTSFFKDKIEIVRESIISIKKVQLSKGLRVIVVRIHHESEFDQDDSIKYFNEHHISQNF